MAKPTVTEEELKAGLSSLGGFGGLTGAGTARRDSPFGTSFAKTAPAAHLPQPAPVTPAAIAAPPLPTPKQETVIELKTPIATAAPVTQAAPQPVVTPPQQPAPTVAPVKAPEVNLAPRAPQASAVTPQPVSRPVTPSPIAKQRITPEPRTARPSEAQEKPPTSHSAPKSDMYTERVTTIMSPEMRDHMSQLAANLQRRKNDPTERITANTLTRVAIKIFLEELLPLDTEAPRTEEELYALTKAKVKRRT